MGQVATVAQETITQNHMGKHCEAQVRPTVWQWEKVRGSGPGLLHWQHPGVDEGKAIGHKRLLAVGKQTGEKGKSRGSRKTLPWWSLKASLSPKYKGLDLTSALWLDRGPQLSATCRKEALASSRMTALSLIKHRHTGIVSDVERASCTRSEGKPGLSFPEGT